jgi:hypothetical protein
MSLKLIGSANSLAKWIAPEWFELEEGTNNDQ